MECQPMWLKYSAWYSVGMFGICDPATTPTHCGSPYLCSKFMAISTSLSSFGNGISSGSSTSFTAVQNSRTHRHTVVTPTPNKCETSLNSLLVVSFHSAIATRFFMGTHRRKLVSRFSIAVRNLWQRYRNVSSDIRKLWFHCSSVKLGTTAVHQSFALWWTQTEGGLRRNWQYSWIWNASHTSSCSSIRTTLWVKYPPWKDLWSWAVFVSHFLYCHWFFGFWHWTSSGASEFWPLPHFYLKRVMQQHVVRLSYSLSSPLTSSSVPSAPTGQVPVFSPSKSHQQISLYSSTKVYTIDTFFSFWNATDCNLLNDDRSDVTPRVHHEHFVVNHVTGARAKGLRSQPRLCLLDLVGLNLILNISVKPVPRRARICNMTRRVRDSPVCVFVSGPVTCCVYSKSNL